MAAPVPFTRVAWNKFVEYWIYCVLGYAIAFLCWMMPTVVTEKFALFLFLFTLLFTSIAVVADFPAKPAFIIFLLMLVGCLLIIVIVKVFHIPVVSYVVQWISSLDVHFNVTAQLLWVSAWTVAWICNLFFCRIWRRYFILPGKVIHPIPFEGNVEYTLSPEYPATHAIDDYADYLLTFGGGTLILTERLKRSPERIRGIFFGIKALDLKLDEYEAEVAEVPAEREEHAAERH